MYRNRIGVKKSVSLALSMLSCLTALTPAASFACACGCGVFDVGTSAMLPTHEGGMAFVEYDFMNQNRNWHGTSSAAAANNNDKNITTSFYTAGAQYMFSRAWGVEAQVPVWNRHFTTTDQDSGDIVKFDHTAIGDVRVKGVYSGFSADMSSGITFGLKLPTGNDNLNGFDRDTAIGSGSTDILLGAYHMGILTASFNWFANGEIELPALIRNDYRPGSEADAVGGVYYTGWAMGNIYIAPVAQVIGSYRLQDRGLKVNHDNSGYERMLLSPGIEVDVSGLRIYGDVGIPVYQQVKGNQLVARELFKLNISHSF